MLLGHGNEEVVEAVREQVGKGMTFFANNEKGLELAEEICRAVPCASNFVMSLQVARLTCMPCALPEPIGVSQKS